MPGAIEAAKEMEKAGFNVFICTSPILKSRYCTQEKLNWIRNYLGESWLHKVIISQDKVITTILYFQGVSALQLYTQ
jgi:5'(3')-deoxyribonucleotidase